jgi:hypothetical protein
VNTSLKTLTLSKPKDRETIDVAALGYICERARGLAYDLVITEFEESGISQADLAARLNKGTAQISRWLGSPGNWTFDTYAMLLFAISGAMPIFGREYPLDFPARNQCGPDWLNPDPVSEWKTLDAPPAVSITKETSYPDTITIGG